MADKKEKAKAELKYQKEAIKKKPGIWRCHIRNC